MRYMIIATVFALLHTACIGYMGNSISHTTQDVRSFYVALHGGR